jgi:hypothetical protein
LNPVSRPIGPSFALDASRLFRFLAVVAIIGVLIGACGGDDDNASTGSTGPSDGGSTDAEATTGPEGATGPGGSNGSTAAPGGNTVAGTLNALPSYRYEVTLEGEGSLVEAIGLDDVTGATGTSGSFQYSIKGAWIAPDKAQLEMDFAGQTVKQTIIGNQQWLNVGGIAQGPIPADGKAEDLILAADFIDTSTIESTLADFDCSKTEDVNGVRSTRCEGDLEDFNRAQDQFGNIFDDTSVREVTGFKSVIWIAEEGQYAVKANMEMVGKTTDGQDFTLALTMDIRDIGQVAEITP